MISLDLETSKSQLAFLTTKISDHLAYAIDQGLWLRYRNFYGDSFALLLLSYQGQLTSERECALIDSYSRKDFDDSQFHWEFNNYAFSCFEANREGDFSFWRSPLRFKNTPCTNWTALRTNVKMRMATDDASASLESLLDLLESRQLPSGLILDDIGVKSFQYHFFSATMLGEIYQMTGDERVHSRWISAVEFILPFIMPHGDANYIGRGQAQSFGHASLVYLLCLYIEIEARYDLIPTFEKILQYLNDHLVCYASGDFAGISSLPLVLNNCEGVPPTCHSMTSEDYLGWYPYNNYFDYLPFSGVFLKKALIRIEQWPKCVVENELYRPISYSDGNFIVERKNHYCAVVSKPDGYWSNDLLFPLIYCASGKGYISSINGGEQFQQSLYHLLDLPAPQWKKLTFRWRCRSLIFGNYLFLFSVFGLAVYRYHFAPKSISVTELIFSLFPFKGTVALDSSWEETSRDRQIFKKESWEFTSSQKLAPLRTVFNALGKCTLYRAGRLNRYCYRMAQ